MLVVFFVGSIVETHRLCRAYWGGFRAVTGRGLRKVVAFLARHALNIKNSSTLKCGDWVEVRSKEEILQTLDKNGQISGLPFMPEMFAFCGQRFSVYRRAHKSCDTVTGEYKGRKMSDAVHLDGVRCDGQCHDGCEAGCMIFWKDAWLRKASPPGEDAETGRR